MTLPKILRHSFATGLMLVMLAGLVACGTAVTELENNAVVANLPTAVAPASTLVSEPELEPMVAPETGSSTAVDTPPLTEAEPLPGEFFPIDQVDIFSDTTFTLNTPLPTTPTTAVVYQIPGQRLTLESATAVAAQFGFSGPLYQEKLPGDFTITDNDITFQPQMPFRAFAGQEELTIMAGYTFYENRAVRDSFPSTIPTAQAQAAAEAFLNGRGLLTFPYEVRAPWGGDIHFHELINGILLESPRLVVHVNNDSDIVRVSYTPETELLVEVEDTVTTAVSAWAKIEEGVIANRLTYNLFPAESAQDQPLPPGMMPDLRWVRVRPAGENTVLYGYPTVLVNATNPDTAPRVQLLGYELLGTAEQMAELANVGGQNTAVQGIISPDGQQLEIMTWDLVSLAPLAVQGKLSEADGRVMLTTADGQQYWLPNPPANIVADTAGQTVDLFAWDAVTLENDALPRLEWETMQVFSSFGNEQMGQTDVDAALSSFIPFAEFQPYRSVTIDSVRLVYFAAPQSENDFSQPPQFDFPPQLLEPMWEFTGLADGEDVIRLYVPAFGE